MADPVKLTDQIDRLLAQNNAVQAYAEYEDGYEAGLRAARELAAAHAEMQSEQVDNIAAVMAGLLKEYTALQKQIEEHVCECDCESAEDLKELRSGIEDLTSDLKGLL